MAHLSSCCLESSLVCMSGYGIVLAHRPQKTIAGAVELSGNAFDGGAVLVGHGDDESFSVMRGKKCAGPHVVADRVFRALVEIREDFSGRNDGVDRMLFQAFAVVFKFLAPAYDAQIVAEGTFQKGFLVKMKAQGIHQVVGAQTGGGDAPRVDGDSCLIVMRL